MVELIRRKDADFKVRDVSSVGRAVGTGAQNIGRQLAGMGKEIERQEQYEQKQYQSQVQQNIKEEQTRLANEKKTFDAADKLVASDMASRLKNDLLRWNLEQRQNNPNYIGTPEHEKRMRDEYARLSSKYGQGLGEAGMAEFQNKTQSAVNEFIGNDVKWAYQQKIKQGEESAKNIAEAMNQTAGMYGVNGDVEGFKESHKENRDKLKEYGEDSGMVGISPALYEADKKSMVNFYDGLAQTDPVKAKTLLENPELFKETVPQDMIDNVNGIASGAKMRELGDQLAIVNAGIVNEKDKKEVRKLEKAKDNIEKEIKKAKDKDYTDESLAAINNEVKQAVSKSIDYNINLQKQAEERERNAQRIGSSLEFMDNPILYRAKTERAFGKETIYSKNVPTEIQKQIDKKASEIYSLADKVGDGKVSPGTMQMVVNQVASITADDKTGVIDDNILKAYDGYLALQKAGASPEQLQTYHKMVEMAMTDTSFKQGVAALANKPSFDSILFLQNPSRAGGLAFFTRTVKDDDVQYVENMGRQAYFEAMNTMSQPNLNEEQRKQAISQALSTYDRRIEEAYDFIKKDVVDVEYVNKQLAKLGSAMVELNGNMTKIVGRLPNGEYIIESTGEKVDAKF